MPRAIEVAPANYLRRSFFARPTLDCARSLIGRLLVRETPDGVVGGRIVEVEAYVGADDPACHAAAGRTRRNRVMWGPPGFIYVYFTYGMHHCMNLVTEPDGFAAAVLLRALEPTVGVSILAAHRAHLPRPLWLSGPGRICSGLGIDLRHNGADLERGPIRVGRGRREMGPVGSSPRIGIRHGRDRRWRYYVLGHPSVSGGRGPAGGGRRRA